MRAGAGNRNVTHVATAVASHTPLSKPTTALTVWAITGPVVIAAASEAGTTVATTRGGVGAIPGNMSTFSARIALPGVTRIRIRAVTGNMAYFPTLVAGLLR